MISRTFNTLKLLKEYMGSLSYNQVRSCILSRSVANSFSIKHEE